MAFSSEREKFQRVLFVGLALIAESGQQNYQLPLLSRQ